MNGSANPWGRDSRRSLFTFLAFLGLALLCRLGLGLMTVDYPHPSQRESLALGALLPIFALGLLGAWLAPYAGFSAGPVTATAWRRTLIWCVTVGVAAGLLLVGLDVALGFSKLLAAKLGVQRIHLAFPASLLAYTVGGTVVECIYRIIPLPLLLGLWRLAARGRGMDVAFWVLAVLTSLLEPLSQGAILKDQPLLFALLGSVIFAVNLFEARLFLRFGVAAPLLVRLSLYLVWHIALGPLVTGV